MALSEEEKRLLDALERDFYAREADVVAAPVKRLSRRNIVLGIVLCALGVGLLITGVALQLMLLGVLGFAVMVGAFVFASTPVQQGADQAAAGGDTPEDRRRDSNPKESFSERLERRWQERQDGTR